LTGSQLWREIRERGYTGGHIAVTDYLRTVRPALPVPFKVRFETPPGQQAQVDFARFAVKSADEAGVTRIAWLVSMVLDHSRHIGGTLRSASGQTDGPALPHRRLHGPGRRARRHPLRPHEDRVPGESEDGHIVYSRPLVALVAHYGFLPRACRPDGAETTAKVERPFRDLREGVFPARRFRDLEDLNVQLGDWLTTVANVRLHGTTQRLAAEASAEERPRL